MRLRIRWACKLKALRPVPGTFTKIGYCYYYKASRKNPTLCLAGFSWLLHYHLFLPTYLTWWLLWGASHFRGFCYFSFDLVRMTINKREKRKLNCFPIVSCSDHFFKSPLSQIEWKYTDWQSSSKLRLDKELLSLY